MIQGRRRTHGRRSRARHPPSLAAISSPSSLVVSRAAAPGCFPSICQGRRQNRGPKCPTTLVHPRSVPFRASSLNNSCIPQRIRGSNQGALEHQIQMHYAFILLVIKRPDQYLLRHVNRTNDATPGAVDVDGGGNRIRFTTLLISPLPPISPGPGPRPDQVQDDRNIVAPTFDYEYICGCRQSRR